METRRKIWTEPPINPMLTTGGQTRKGLIAGVRSRAWLFIALLVVVALIAFAALVSHHNRDDYRHQMAAAEEHALNVSVAVATQVGEELRHAERVVSHTTGLFVTTGGGAGDLAAWVARSRSSLALLVDDGSVLDGMVVLDPSGSVIAGFGVPDWTQVPESRRLVVAGTRSASRASLIGGAVPGAVVLSRELVGADGRVAGILAAAVDFQEVRGLLRRSVVAGRQRVLVLNESGAVLFGEGAEEAGTGVSPENMALLHEVRQPERSGVVRGAGRGAPLHAFCRLADWPILVVVDWTTEAIEVRRHQRAWRDGLLVAGLGLLLIVLAALHAREQRRARAELSYRVYERTDELARVNRRLLDAERLAHLGHWERDLVTGEGVWSDENFRIYGLTPEPTSPPLERFLECIHPEDREALVRMRDRVEAGAASYELRTRVVRPDGTIRHVSSQAAVVRDVAGRMRRLIGTTLDITALVEAEERLRESEEKYRTVFEVARDAIYLVDRDTHAIVAANRSARRVYGYSTEEFLRLTTTDLSAEPERTLEALRSGQAFVPLRRHRRKDGTEIYVELMSARAQVGARVVLVMAARDITERVASEARLATAKARLIEAERIAHLGHWEWLPLTDAHFWSEELFRILGASPVDMRPSWPALLALLHPDDQAAVAALPETLARTGDTGDLEVRVCRNDGGARRIHVTLQVTRDAQGQITCMFGTALDVSDRYAAQQALLESHAALSAVINATEHDMVLLINPDGTVQIANEKVARIYGRPVADIVGQRLDAFMPIEVAAQRQALIDHVLETGGSVHLEETEAGLVFDTHCAPALGPDGRHLGVAVFARNITGRKEVENSLRKLSRAIEQTPLSVVITDLDGFIEYVNPHFTQVTGYPASEVIGRNSRVLKSGYTRPPDYRSMWKTIAAGDVWSGEFHNKTRDGRLFWERAAIAPVRDDQGVVTHYVAIKEDITERKRAEHELLAAKERAEAANIAKSQFLATVSHELRTPLNAIIGFSECMREAAFGPIGDERYQRFAGNIHDAGTHLLKLINDILDLAHAEAGTLQLSETIVDPHHEIQAAVDEVRGVASEAGLRLTVDLPEHLPLLYADERALRQIVSNLLSNAVKFTPSGGQISIRAQVEDSGLFALQVSDTGIGIPADRVGEVVRPFSQVDGEFSREHEGAGLGLPLCRSIAELHGGHLDIESAVKFGTTVTVRFPRDRVLLPGQDIAALAPGLTG